MRRQFIFLFLGFILVLLILKAIVSLNIEPITSIEPVIDPEILLGKGEVCQTPQLDLGCEVGLKCILTHLDSIGDVGVCAENNQSLPANFMIEREYYKSLDKNRYLADR